MDERETVGHGLGSFHRGRLELRSKVRYWSSLPFGLLRDVVVLFVENCGGLSLLKVLLPYVYRRALC